MISHRQLFLLHNAQTSPAPLMIEIEKAEGNYLINTSGKHFLDFLSGVSVCNVGHRHPHVIKAITDQLGKYMHTMVYGEFIQSPQTLLAKKLNDHLSPKWNNETLSVYYGNSGAEAIDGALKLAKRATGRSGIIAFKNAYHGSTHAALSLMSNEEFKNPFRPLLPDVRFLDFNNFEQLQSINSDCACVVLEIIQSETGYTLAENNWLTALKNKCTEVGALLIIDEIQTGFGRTGTMFAFEQTAIVPDILVCAKGMGGGMPIGCFIAAKQLMDKLSHNPVLGHITTFGGHPVCCAASMATMEVIENENLLYGVAEKENLIRLLLQQNKTIKNISGKGLMLSLEFENFEQNKAIIDKCIEKGLLTDWFLHAANKLRLTPPLTITNEEIKKACGIIIESIEMCG
ncbi:MAG: aspartate aminotransferase family protein [Bacteroidota bacterium]|nr:aspartate aminotransferase family protein [Bacteroidota bacterium]